MAPSNSDTPKDSITLASIENGPDVVNKSDEPTIDRVAIEPITLEQWNKPRINLYRYLATLYSFIIMGESPMGSLTNYLLILDRHERCGLWSEFP